MRWWRGPRTRNTRCARWPRPSCAWPGAVQSTESAYVAGRTDFLVLLESLVTLRELEMERLEAVARRGVAGFELDRIVASGGVR